MVSLPEAFLDRMQRILGEEYPAFLQSYEQPRHYGLRVNTLKITPERFEQIAPFHLTPVSWIPGAYEYLEEDEVSRHPYYYAGLYYLQEPSAMTPAQILDAQPGEKILDLCAAPGGKSTAIGAALNRRGVLVANDISASRCRALLHNIELFGIPNAVVTNEVPSRMTPRFRDYFDKVLLDAPCSGEGMFRKDIKTAKAWYPEKNEECAKIQRDLILQAADMLRPGGWLVYSTCTFSPVENEDVIAWLLEQRPEMHLKPIPRRPGFSGGIDTENLDKNCVVRLWPHRTGGEGHFIALLEKEAGSAWIGEGLRDMEETSLRTGRGNEQNAEAADRKAADREIADRKTAIRERIGKAGKGKKTGRTEKSGRTEKAMRQPLEMSVHLPAEQERLLRNLEGSCGLDPAGILANKTGKISIPLPDSARLEGMTCFRNGLLLGEVRKDRFEPSQACALAVQNGTNQPRLKLSAEDTRIGKYLRGDVIDVLETDEISGEGTDGWYLICVEDYPLGWGKLVQGRMKNKYLAGWRIL